MDAVMLFVSMSIALLAVAFNYELLALGVMLGILYTLRHYGGLMVFTGVAWLLLYAVKIFASEGLFLIVGFMAVFGLSWYLDREQKILQQQYEELQAQGLI